jgi:hypothetical protein
MRWALFIVLIAIAACVLAPLPGMMGAPDPGRECNPDAVSIDQNAYASAFGHWIFRQVAVLTTLVTVLVVAAFYLQIFHYSLGGWGTLARLSLVGMLALAAGWQLLSVSERWALRQRTGDGPSCLVQALETSASSKAAILTGPWLAAPPDRWTFAVRVDMAILLAVGLIAGLAFYALVRRLFRL